jgi:molybdenum cofactor synthesis domain-containing protein
LPIRFAILTISDRSASGERADTSGPALAEVVRGEGWSVLAEGIIPDERATISATLAGWADAGKFDVILTTGGTGFGPRDVTPEASESIYDRKAPGLAEAMRIASIKRTPHAMLSRATCGIRGRTLIVNLPGSPKAAIENLQIILPVLPHAVQLLSEDPQAEAGHAAPGR